LKSVNYKQKYKNHYNIADDEIIMCEACNCKIAVDIHHLIFRSQRGTDEINNLMPLCRNCHTKAHSNKQFNEQLKQLKNEKK